MKKYLNFPVLILSAFVVRPIIQGASIGDAIAIIALAAIYAGHYYLESKKEPIANKDLIDRVIYLEEQFQTVRDSVQSIRLGGMLKK